MKWLYVLLTGALILGGGVVGVVAVVHEPPRVSTPVPEPLAPVMLIEADGLIGGGSVLVHLRDATGHEFDFRITKSDVEVHDERHNRLIVVDANERRVVALHSAEEENLKRALVLAINYRRENPEVSDSPVNSDSPSTDEERLLMYAEAALARFSHLGKPWPF